MGQVSQMSGIERCFEAHKEQLQSKGQEYVGQKVVAVEPAYDNEHPEGSIGIVIVLENGNRAYVPTFEYLDGEMIQDDGCYDPDGEGECMVCGTIIKR